MDVSTVVNPITAASCVEIEVVVIRNKWSKRTKDNIQEIRVQYFWDTFEY